MTNQNIIYKTDPRHLSHDVQIQLDQLLGLGYALKQHPSYIFQSDEIRCEEYQNAFFNFARDLSIGKAKDFDLLPDLIKEARSMLKQVMKNQLTHFNNHTKNKIN